VDFMMTKRHVARGARPDAETNNKIYLIKKVSNLRCTYQIRMLLYRAVQEGTKLVLDVPYHCELSPSLNTLIKEHRGSIEVTRN
jgi:hypothetical protein